MKKIITVSLITIFMLTFPQEAFSGAWTQLKGKSLHVIKYVFYTTTRNFLSYGKIKKMANHGKFQKHEINYYTEWGLTDRITAVGNFFFDFLKYRDEFGEDGNAGFADQEVGLRYNILKDPLVFSAQGLVVFPAYNRKHTPLLGIQDVGLEGKFLIGKSFKTYKWNSFINFEAGYRKRMGRRASDQVRYYIGYGIEPIEGWKLILSVDGNESLRNGKKVNVENLENVTIDPDISLIKTSLDLEIPIVRNKVSVLFGSYWHALGRNTGEGWGITGGIVIRT